MSNSVWWEIAVAGIGVVVAATLGIGQLQISRAQNALLADQAQREAAKSKDEERRSADALEVQVMAMVAPQLALMRESGQKGKDAQDIVAAAVEYLSKHERPGLAAMSAKIMEGLPAVSPIAQSRVKEATAAPSDADVWFVVLASLPDNRLDSARAIAADKGALAAKLKVPGAITIYKTKISRNYAVVIGGPLPGGDAEVLARTARNAGLAGDAFPQQNKSWALVE